MLKLSPGSRWAIGATAILTGASLLWVSTINGKPVITIIGGSIGFLIGFVCFFPKASVLANRIVAAVGCAACLGIIYKGFTNPNAHFGIEYIAFPGFLGFSSGSFAIFGKTSDGLAKKSPDDVNWSVAPNADILKKPSK